MSDFKSDIQRLMDYQSAVNYFEETAEPKMHDLAFKINEMVEVNKQLDQLLGEILATLQLPNNQKQEISQLTGLLILWKNKRERLSIGIT